MGQPLDIWMVFHVVAGSEEAADASLDDHLEKLEGEPSVTDFDATVEETEEVDNPHEGLEKGYSKVAEVELTVTGFDRVVDLVINYGPTSVDVQAPEEMEMDIGEVRNALNSVAQMMHQFLQSGAGGMMVSRPNQ